MIAGFEACAVRNPDGAVWACTASTGSKNPAKMANAAAVTIRFIRFTQRLLSARTVSDCRAEVNRASAINPVGATMEHALDKSDVDSSQSALARRNGSHGA